MKREKGGFWVGVVAVVFYPLSWLARKDYRGGDHIPLTGPALLAMNHVSHLDPIIDATFVHRYKRVPRFLAKASVMDAPVTGRIFRGAGSIAVYRGTSAAGDALRDAHQALRDGKAVLIYPEGTITKRADGWMKNTFTGVARLALENDVPVIPIARWGTNHMLDGYLKKFRPLPRKTVTYTAGKPVDLSAYRNKPPTAAVLREVTDLIDAEITRLLAEIRGEEPPAAATKAEAADA